MLCHYLGVLGEPALCLMMVYIVMVTMTALWLPLIGCDMAS